MASYTASVVSGLPWDDTFAARGGRGGDDLYISRYLCETVMQRLNLHNWINMLSPIENDTMFQNKPQK